MADLGDPAPCCVARALGVSERTVWRWQAAEAWPRAAHLAVFFASSWGWSAVECDARFRVATAESLADALRRELEASRAAAERAHRLSDYGSANAPTWQA